MKTIKYKHKFIEEIELMHNEEHKYCIYLFEQYGTDGGLGASIFYADTVKEIKETLKHVELRRYE